MAYRLSDLWTATPPPAVLRSEAAMSERRAYRLPEMAEPQALGLEQGAVAS